jgi:hypothetical protein
VSLEDAIAALGGVGNFLAWQDKGVGYNNGSLQGATVDITPIPAEVAGLGEAASAAEVLGQLEAALPGLADAAGSLSAYEAAIAAEAAAATAGSSAAAAGLVYPAAGLVEGAMLVGIAGLEGIAAAALSPLGALSIIGGLVALGVLGYFNQSPNKSIPSLYTGAFSMLIDVPLGNEGRIYTLEFFDPAFGRTQAASGLRAPIKVLSVQRLNEFQYLWTWSADNVPGAQTVSISPAGGAQKFRLIDENNGDVIEGSGKFAPQSQSANRAAASPIRSAFPGYPFPATSNSPLTKRPPVIEPSPPRITYPGAVPNPPQGKRMTDPNTGTTIDRQPSPDPANPANPDPKGKGTTTGTDPNTGFTTVVPKDDAGTTSGKTEVTQSGSAGCRFQNTNLAGIAQQATSVAIQTAVASVEEKATKIKEDTVETLKRIGSGRDPGEGDGARPENLTAIAAKIRDEVGMRRVRKGRKGKSLASLGEMAVDTHERVGFTTATSTKKCDLPKTLENLEDATKDLRERAGFDKKIKKKRNKRDKDGNFLRDELGNLQKEEKSYCSISDALDDQLDEQPDSDIADPIFLVGFEVPAPTQGYIEIIWSQNDRIQRDTAATIREPKDKLTRSQIVTAAPVRYVGDWLCAIAFTNGREVSGWFRNEQEGKAYLTKLATLSKLKLAPAASNFTATHRPGKGPDKAKGKSVKPVVAYLYDASGNKVSKIDLRKPKT